MRARLVLGLLFACVPVPALAQGFAGLGADASEYAQVTPGREFSFPADHGAHPDFRIEWWYVTANLAAPDGTQMGAQWTLFRQAAAPRGDAEGWASNQLWMGHAAVTTPEGHALAETFARGGIGQAGVLAEPFEAWINDWRMTGTGTGDPLDRLALSARGADFSFALELEADGPIVLQGEDGYSVKSQQGQASYYYSQPFYRVTGSVMLDGAETAVTGRAWLDREWSSQPLAATQDGWDWFALHLPAGEKLMVYRLRSTDGSAYAIGTWIGADGKPTPLPDGALEIAPLASAPVAGRSIPVRWRLRIPGKDFEVETAALNAQSYMAAAFAYWEGPIRFTGTHEGVGYLEMTGY